MAAPTVTVDRCYQTRDGWFAVVKGQAYPTDAEVAEGKIVRIVDGRAVAAR